MRLQPPKIMSNPQKSCSARKLLSPPPVLNSAAANGAPISDAIEPMPCAMPNLAPSTFGSGHTIGKMLGGSGINGPLKSPYRKQ